MQEIRVKIDGRMHVLAIPWREDNTEGYTDAELDRLNQEVQARLNEASVLRFGELTPEEAEDIIRRHADDVAHR